MPLMWHHQRVWFQEIVAAVESMPFAHTPCVTHGDLAPYHLSHDPQSRQLTVRELQASITLCRSIGLLPLILPKGWHRVAIASTARMVMGRVVVGGPHGRTDQRPRI